MTVVGKEEEEEEEGCRDDEDDDDSAPASSDDDGRDPPTPPSSDARCIRDDSDVEVIGLLWVCDSIDWMDSRDLRKSECSGDIGSFNFFFFE